MNNKLNNNFSLRKLLLTALVAGPLATLPAPLWALPSTDAANLTTSSGVTTQIVGSTLNITAPDKAILTWQAFGSGLTNSIGSGDVINYFLPASNSSVLNSVSGGVSSTISGSLISNGNVYVLNPAGIVLTSTARINTGGFYASTVAEPSGFFSINGSLSFAGTSTSNITVQGTGITSGTDVATIQAVGAGNNIYLAGNNVNIEGGKFFGNLFVRASGTGTNTTIASTGPVSVNLVGVPLAGGGLNITTNGGNVVLTGAKDIGALDPSAVAPATRYDASLTIAPGVSATTGAVVINTTGSATNGSISQGASLFSASTTGTVVTLNAGTGTSAGNITLGNTNFLTLGSSGNNISITDAGGLALGATNAAGTLTVNAGSSNTLSSSGTVTAGGNIDVLARSITISGSGNLTFSNIAASSTLSVTTAGDITINGLTTSPARVLSLTSSGGKLAVNSALTTSTLTLAAPAGTISVTGLTTSGTTTDGQAGAASITALGDISLAGVATRSNSGQNTNMTVTSSTGNITLGAITAASNLTATATAGSITATTINSQALTLTAANGSVSTGNISAANTVAISGGSVTVGDVKIGDSGLTLTASTGSLSTGAISSGTAAATLSAPSLSGSITTNGTITKGATSAAFTITSGGSINLGANNVANTITVPTLVVTSTGGSITQSAPITSTSKTTLNAAGDISLTTSSNDFGNVVLIGGASSTGGFSVTDANAIVIGSATNTMAPVTITSGAAGAGAAADISLGAAAIDTLRFGSSLTLKMFNATNTGAITTNANAVSVFGNVSVTTFNNNHVTLGSNIFGNAANFTYGQINADIGTGKFSVYENQTLNLGTITAGSLDARSLSSDIVNSGALKIGTVAVNADFVTQFGGNAVFAANSIFSPGNITLNHAGNTIAGNLVIGNAKDVTITNAMNTSVIAGSTGVNGKAATGTTSITVLGAASTLNVSTAAGGDFGVLSFSAPAAVTILDPNALTLQNVVTTGANSGAINVTTTNGVLTLGSGISLGGTGPVTFIANGAAGGIVDSAPNIKIFGESSFKSSNSITITNSGHSLGAVNLETTGINGANGTANITYTEGGTANLKNVLVNSGGGLVPAGAASLTVVSTGGDIIQTNLLGYITVPNAGNAGNTATFTSNVGGVRLDDTNPGVTKNNIATAVTLTAAGNSSIVQGNNIVLGNVAVSAGTLTVNSAGVAAKTVTQAAGTTVKAYGASSFTSAAGAITLANTGNNFGGLTLASGGADVAITEAGTLNLVSVNTGAGKLAAISQNAGIIQTGTAGLTVGGASTLTAAADGVTLFGTTNNFGAAGIQVTTVGNVSIQDSNAVTVLNGNSTIGGSLTLKNNTAGGTGEIKDSPGTLTVSGNVVFDTTSTIGSKVNIGSSTASLGAIRFLSGTVTIVENATLNLLAGSVASGDVSLTSSGNIITSGAGGGTFQKKLDLNASGSITITNPILVYGASSTGPGLTFRALGAVDLSALSLAGNLNSIAPTNLGASSYKAPSP